MSTRLLEEWLKDPEFKSWISGRPGDDFYYCKLCKKELLCNGKSALRAHASGQRHSDLAALRKKQRKPANTKKPTGSLGGGSQTTGVNINFINSRSSTPFRTQQNVSTTAQNEYYHASSYGMHSSSNAQPLRHLIRDSRSPSPGISIMENLGSLNDFSRNDDRTEQLRHFEQTIDEMFKHQNSVISSGISDILEMYRDSLSFRNHRKIREICNAFKSSSENLRKKTKLELLRAFLE